MLSWIQSLIKDEAMREIMFDLSSVSRQLHEPDFNREQIGNRLYKVHANLMRRQAEI